MIGLGSVLGVPVRVSVRLGVSVSCRGAPPGPVPVSGYSVFCSSLLVVMWGRRVAAVCGCGFLLSHLLLLIGGLWGPGAALVLGDPSRDRV